MAAGRPGRPVARKSSSGCGLLLPAALDVFAAIAAAIWLWCMASHAVAHPSADLIVTIDHGSGTAATIERLTEAGIVRHPLALRLYATLTGKSKSLKAGDYKFAAPISPLEAIDKIR